MLKTIATDKDAIIYFSELAPIFIAAIFMFHFDTGRISKEIHFLFYK